VHGKKYDHDGTLRIATDRAGKGSSGANGALFCEESESVFNSQERGRLVQKIACGETLRPRF